MPTEPMVITPVGQHIMISDAYLQELDRTGKTLSFRFAGKTNNLILEIENLDIHNLSLALLLLATNPKIKKVSA